MPCEDALSNDYHPTPLSPLASHGKTSNSLNDFHYMRGDYHFGSFAKENSDSNVNNH